MPGHLIDPDAAAPEGRLRALHEISMELSRSVGYGQLGERDLRSAGGNSLQWSFWLHLLSSFVLLQQLWDLEGCLLREGNVHRAKNWKAVLDPIVSRYRDRDILRYFRGDAAFDNPHVYSYLEVERYWYAIRLRSNEILNREIEHLMKRPVGRPPRGPIVLYHEFMYQAAAWDRQHRVIAKVEWHRGELFPRVGFIVTNLRWTAKSVVRFYNHRGTAEQMIKEDKNAIKWTRLSCHVKYR